MTSRERDDEMDGARRDAERYRLRDRMTGDILDVYSRATAADVAAGRDWYPTAGRIVAGLADWSGCEVHRVAAALATLSPRNPWRWNVADAANYAHAAALGGVMPSATTFGANRLKAWAILTGTDAAIPTGRKVASFAQACTGRTDAVVIDTWAMRVASRGAWVQPGRDGAPDYDLVALAYRIAAADVGETPRDLQAITWLVAQREGIGSQRIGRHDLAFKAGTPEIVRELIAD